MTVGVARRLCDVRSRPHANFQGTSRNVFLGSTLPLAPSSSANGASPVKVWPLNTSRLSQKDHTMLRRQGRGVAPTMSCQVLGKRSRPSRSSFSRLHLLTPSVKLRDASVTLKPPSPDPTPNPKRVKICLTVMGHDENGSNGEEV